MKVKHWLMQANRLPKRLITGFVMAIALGLPTTVLASQVVHLATSDGIADTSAGDTKFRPSTHAKLNDQLEAVINLVNAQNQAGSSGETMKSLRVKVFIPAKPVSRQIISTSVSAANLHVIHHSVTVLSGHKDAIFVFSPGSVTLWKDGKRQRLSDRIVTGPDGLDIGNLKPGKSMFVTFYGNLELPAKTGVKLTNQSELSTASNEWSANNTARPGDTLKYRLALQNTGNTTENNIIISDKLPVGETLVPNTTTVTIGKTKKTDATNGPTGGIDIGTLRPNVMATVQFEAKIAAVSKLACGMDILKNTGNAQLENVKAITAVAVTKVSNGCEPHGKGPQPTFACTAFAVKPNNDRRTVSVSDFQITATNGASFLNAVIDWGDGAQTKPLAANAVVGQTHQYPNTDQHLIQATASFKVNDKTEHVVCPSQPISFTMPPATSSNKPTTPIVTTATVSELVNTGAGNVMSLFVAAGIVGFVGYRLFLQRHLGRR